MKEKKESYFWASYADLMTSLFFIMLVLFVITIALLQRQINEVEKQRAATEKQLDKINEVEKATQNIDPKYFQYRPEYKKHILRIEVKFNTGSSTMLDMPLKTLEDLKDAGQSIEKLIATYSKDYIQYLLIIEGQASKDLYTRNYELSYERALALKKFWGKNDIEFGDNCEVLISGSGDGELSGTDFMRESLEGNNQRFLIHIIPKYGTIE